MVSNSSNPQPVVIGKNKTPDERVVVFIIGDVEYSVPKRPRPYIGLKYMRTLKESGSQEIAIAGLLEDMLGKDGYEALTECEDLTDDDFEQVMKIIQSLAMGDVEKTSKN